MADRTSLIVQLDEVWHGALNAIRPWCRAGLVTALLLTLSNATDAAESTGVQSFDIPVQPLSSALASYARQAGVQIFFPTAQIAGRESVAVQGRLDKSTALRELLAGTGLEVASDDGQTIVLRPEPEPPRQTTKPLRPAGHYAGNDAASPLEEVIVRGTPRAGTLKRDNETVANTITELEIKRLPNLDVSDVIARLPGVLRDETQSGEDRYVQIRGLPNAAASQSIDGVLLTDYINSSRAASTELLPPNFMQSMTVTTTVTPDLDENSNAAHVAMSTISGLDNEGQHLMDVRGYLGYDSRSGGDRSTRQPMRLSGTWRGGLDKDNRLGLAVAGELDRLGSRQDARSIAGYKVITGFEVPNGSLTAGETYTQTQRISALARLDARLARDLAVFGEYLYLQHDFQTDQQSASASVSASEAVATTATSGQFYSASQVYGFSQGAPRLRDHLIQAGGDFRIGGTEALSFRLGMTLNTVRQSSMSIEGFGIGSSSLQTPLSYDISGNGIALSPGASTLTANPGLYRLSGKTIVNDTVSEDHNYFARVDYLRNVYQGQLGWGFKAGVQLKTLARVNVQNGYARVLAPGQSLSLAEITGAGRVDQLNPVSWNQAAFLQLINQRGIPSPDSNGLYASDPADGYGQDFTASEQIGLGYGIVSYGFEHGRLSAGVRVARTHRDLDQYEPDSNGHWSPAHYEQSYTHALPSVYGYQDFTGNLKLRAAFTQTLQRPALAGSSARLLTSYDTPVTRWIRYSNPYLLPIRSTNFETSAEYYLGPDDAYLSLGVFSKYLRDISALSSSQSVGADGVREIISYTSNVTQVGGKKVYGKAQGIELAWSDPKLVFFPARFGNLGVALGYDYIVYRVTAINGGGGVPATDTRLVDAGPQHLFNLSMFYNRGRFAANVFLQALSSLPLLSYDPAMDRHTRFAPLLDLQASCAITANIRVLVEGRNILDQSISDHYGVTGYGPTYQIRNDGRTLWVGAQLMLF
jgi:iron complex outermembrane receptor protein